MKKLILLILIPFNLFSVSTILYSQQPPVAGSPAMHKAEVSKPNILIFMADDIGYGDINALNPQKHKSYTPHIDKLIESGISFHHAHSAASLCAPSRYALLTGNHVYRGRRANGTWTPFESSQILEGQETLADILRKNDFHTAFFGKVHLGGLFENENGEIVTNFDEADLTRRFKDGPIDHGFDYSLSMPSGIQTSPLAFFKNDRLARYDTGIQNFNYLNSLEIKNYFKKITSQSEKDNYTTEVRGPLFVMDNYTTESVGPLLMNDALRFLDDHFEKHPDKPFYMHFMSPLGHRKYAPPLAFNVSDPLNTQDTLVPGAIRIQGITVNKRTDMVFETDVALGLFMEKLKALGQLNNTIIIYTSDNGAEISENSSWSNPIYMSKDGPKWYRGPYGGDRIEANDYPKHVMNKHYNGQGVGLDGKALRGYKGFVYEGGHRIPLIMRWGGGEIENSIFPPNTRISDQFISLLDLYRTLCTLVGVKVSDNQAVDSFDYSDLLLNPRAVSASNRPVRDFLGIQAWRVADSAPINYKRMTWAFYSYDSNYKIWNAIMSKSKVAGDLNNVNCDELYLLTDDEDQSDDIKSTQNDRHIFLTKEFKTFLNTESTHSGQLNTPEKALNWRNIVNSLPETRQ